MTVIRILLAIFAPPVAAFLTVGLRAQFWINCLLTLLAVLPGSIHALWLITRRDTR